MNTEMNMTDAEVAIPVDEIKGNRRPNTEELIAALACDRITIGEWNADIERAGLPAELALIMSAWQDKAVTIPSPVFTKHNDARVWGHISEALRTHPIALGMAPRIDSKEWRTVEGTLGGFIDQCSKFDVRFDKDGLSFTQGPMKPGARLHASMQRMDAMVIDIDTGQPVAPRLARLRKLGWFAIVPTTHSHMKDVSEIAHKAFIRRLPDGQEPTLADAVEYLREVKHYEPAILEGATLIDAAKTDKDGKVWIVVKHAPMPKMRIILPLAKRFEIESRAGNSPEKRRKIAAEWRALYKAVCEMIGANYDETCTNLNRGFYYPSRKKVGIGVPVHAHIDILAGELLDLDTIVVPDVSNDNDPYAVAGKEMGGNSNANDGKDPEGKLFFAKYGKRFEAARFFEERDPDPQGFVVQRERGGHTHRCPFEHEHTPMANGQRDMGFYVVNAREDADNMEAGAVARCSHNSCKGRDRIDFVGEMLRQAEMTWADLGEYVPGIEGEDDFDPALFGGGEAESTVAPDAPAVQPYKTPAMAKQIVRTMVDKEEGIQIARNIGASDFSPGELDELAKMLSKKTGIGVRALKDEFKLWKPAAKRKGGGKVRSAKPDWLPDGFQVEQAHIVRVVYDDDANIPICDVFRDPALKRDNEGGKWGLRVVFDDLDGNEHEMIVPRDRLVSDASGLIADMVKQGFGVVMDKRSKDWLVTLLGELARRKNLPRVLEVNRPGWHRDGKLFVTPTGEVIGAEDTEEVTLCPDTKAEGAVRKGTMAGSKEVFAACFELPKQWHWALLACCSFAGPVQQLLGELEESGGIGVVGLSGYGKTTGQYVQASAWTDPTAKGCLVECDATLNALEENFLIGTGSTLALNEAHHLPAKVYAQLPFKIAGGRERGRMLRSGKGNREQIGWSLFVTVNCERHARELLGSEGIVMDAGHVARIPEVNVSGDKLPGDHPVLLRMKGAAEHFGHLGPAFVRALIAEGWATPEGRKKLRQEIGALANEIANGDPNLVRPARKFALARWAGEAARRYGLLPADADVAGRLGTAWGTFADGQDATALQGVERAIRKLRETILTKWDTLIVKPGSEFNANGRDIIGYYTAEDGDGVICILADKLAGAGGGTDTAEGIAKELGSRNLLVKHGKNLKHDYVPGKGRLAHYRLPLLKFCPDDVARMLCDIDESGERRQRAGTQPDPIAVAAQEMKTR
jgi:hypothetical protein